MRFSVKLRLYLIKTNLWSLLIRRLVGRLTTCRIHRTLMISFLGSKRISRISTNGRFSID